MVVGAISYSICAQDLFLPVSVLRNICIPAQTWVSTLSEYYGTALKKVRCCTIRIAIQRPFDDERVVIPRKKVKWGDSDCSVTCSKKQFVSLKIFVIRAKRIQLEMQKGETCWTDWNSKCIGPNEHMRWLTQELAEMCTKGSSEPSTKTPRATICSGIDSTRDLITSCEGWSMWTASTLRGVL